MHASIYRSGPLPSLFSTIRLCRDLVIKYTKKVFPVPAGKRAQGGEDEKVKSIFSGVLDI